MTGLGPIGSLSLIEIIFLPPLIFIVSGLSLANFKNIMMAVHNIATQRQSNPVLKQLRPIARPLRNFFEFLFGKAKSFKWTLTDVLLVGVILVLCGVINTQLRSQKAKKAKNDSKKDKTA